MLTRGGEALLVRRSPRLRAFANFWAFPGGTIADADRGVPVAGASHETEANRIAAAVREVFEETGVLLGRLARPPDPGARDRLRRALLDGEMSLAEVLEQAGGRVEASDFVPVAELVTPRSAPYRFDTRFYRLPLPAGAEVSVWPGEIVAAGMFAPATALARWRRGGIALAPPVIGLLERWSDDDEVFRQRNLEAALVTPANRYSPGIAVLPSRTPTLPPATHTNALLVGAERRYLVDPAPEDPAERDALFARVDRLLGPEDRIEAVLVTHHHRDHVGSVAAAAKRYGVPVGAHPETFARIPAPPRGAMELIGGETLELGSAPDGSPGWGLGIRFVPGHAPGHLAFVENRYGAMVVGDMVSSISSVVISPEDGNLAHYLDSLEALAAECSGVVYPGHGVPVIAGRELLEHQLRHRRAREATLLGALEVRPRTLAEIGLDVYPPKEVPASGPMRELALASLTSGLLKLEGEGRARGRSGKWWRSGAAASSPA